MKIIVLFNLISMTLNELSERTGYPLLSELINSRNVQILDYGSDNKRPFIVPKLNIGKNPTSTNFQETGFGYTQWVRYLDLSTMRQVLVHALCE